ncbi:MAG: dihydrodipicolinate synthase family protein [Clostridiales bacterium]|nr:dihydrodipicolinate synthase family protein [Clostridiales bacterium]
MRPEALKVLRTGTVIPAFPLTLTEDGSFDERRQRALIRYYLDAGVGGLAVAVHTTQFAIRNPKIGLFRPILRIAKEETDRFEARTGKTILRVAGCCGPTAQAVSEAEFAKSEGYDAVLLSAGGLADWSIDQLISRTAEVGEIMPVVGFYLQPSVGGRVLPFEYWQKLCELKSVVAIKAAPFNRYQTLDVVRAVAMSSRPDEVTLYTGNDDNIVLDLLTKYRFTKEDGTVVEKGFDGGLLGHWSMWTKTVVDMFGMLRAAAASEEIPTSLLTLGIEITDCNAAFFDAANQFAGCIPGVHEVLRRQGLMTCTRCLNPDEVLSPGQADEITRVYRMYPHLNDDKFVREHLESWLAD